MSRGLILHEPHARAALLRGMEQMTALLRPTLGPSGGTVLVAGVTASNPPTVLTDAATIARRTLQIADPFEDMGAMIVRQLAWSVYQAAGDGAATAAVLCCEIVRQAAPFVAAGGNPMMIKRGLERGLDLALHEVRSQTRPVRPGDDLARIVAHALPDPDLAGMVAEIIATVGPEGAVLIEDGRGTTTAFEYTEGLRWQSGSLSYALVPEATREVRLRTPRLLITDQKLRAADLVPVIEACVVANAPGLLVIAPGLHDDAVALLVANRDREILPSAAAKAPGAGPERDEMLLDLATVTGGRFLRQAAGDAMDAVSLADLGTARQAWVTRDAFGLLGGGGAPREIRQRAAAVRGQLRELPHGDPARPGLERRIGNLAGVSAVIYVGAPVPAARSERRGRIEAAVTLARAACRDGGVPGGGAAYLNAVPAADQLAASLTGDEAFGVTALARALAGPARAIAANAGVEPSIIGLDRDQRSSADAFDAATGTWVDAWAAGIVDPLPVAERALTASASAATMVLTTDVLIRHRRPEYSIDP